MKTSEFLARIQFCLMIIVPFGAALLVVSFLYGCKQKSAEEKGVKPTVTIENLQTAYAKEVKYRDMYARFVKEAEREHMTIIAGLFKAVVRSEAIHAANHARLLRSLGTEPQEPVAESTTVGTTMQTLKMALSCEDIECKSMYPNLARTAEMEKCNEAVLQFRQTAEADAGHAALFQEAVDKNGKILHTQYFICPTCGYVVTSDKTEECPVCHTKKSTFEKV